MNKLQKYSAFTVIVTFVCFSLIGLALVPLLPVKQKPEKELPVMTVTFSMADRPPRVVEEEATSKLEQALSRVDGVRHVNSESSTGGGSITLVFARGAEIAAARFQVATAVRQVWDRLPSGVSYPQINVRFSAGSDAGSFLTYAVCSNESLADMQRLVDEKIIPVLGQIRGVRDIRQNESGVRTMSALCDISQMRVLGITVDDVRNAISETTGVRPLGMAMVDDALGKRLWMSVSIASDGVKPGSLGAIMVRAKSGQLVSLADIVKLSNCADEPVNTERINGLRTVFVSVTAERSANQLVLAGKVKAAMRNIEKSLPPTYEVHLDNDSSVQFGKDIWKTSVRSVLTVLILVFFTFVTTRNRKLAAVVFIGLTVSLCLALGAYYLVGVEIHFYTMAGITISLNLMIDNVIVMAYHIVSRNNIKVFMPMLAATLTSIGALSVIFFLDESVRLNLADFAMAIIVNLASSLLVATFFVPALMEKMNVANKNSAERASRKRYVRISCFNRLYGKCVSMVSARPWVVFALVALAFGLPVFLLPASVDSPENWWQRLYNQTLGSRFYNDNLREVVDKSLGGAIRYFIENSGRNNPFDETPDNSGIAISGHVSEGGSLRQADNMARPMEAFLSRQNGIRRFHTIINGPEDFDITVDFTRSAVDSGVSVSLHNKVVMKALSIGGGSWTVVGPGQMTFSNDARSSAGDIEVWLRGYNYGQLSRYANEFREMLLRHPRIKSVVTSSSRQTWNEKNEELYLELDKLKLMERGISLSSAVSAICSSFGRDNIGLSVPTEGGNVSIELTPAFSASDTWALMNMPVSVGGKSFKVSDVATLEKRQVPDAIVKEDQEYLLCAQFDYLGDLGAADKVVSRDIKRMESRMALGYSIKRKTFGMLSEGGDGFENVSLLSLVLLIVFFITSILFNSLRQPFAILMVIPVSFIGVFLAFGLSELDFGQGGFASLVLLAGITVNSNIYIVDEYNNIRHIQPGLSSVKVFAKALNHKVVPIMLTVVTTILGFVPFVVYGDDTFWLSLSVGTISGLVTSLLGSFVFLPLMLCGKNKKVAKKSCKKVAKVFKGKMYSYFL